MKLLFFSDLHAHNHQQFARRTPEGRNSRFQDCLNVLSFACDVVEKHGVDHVFFLGDLFHSRVSVDMEVYTTTFEYTEALSRAVHEQSRGYLWLLVGNHDQYRRESSVHSLAPFHRIAHVLEERGQFSLEGIQVRYAPHTTDVPGLIEWLDQTEYADLLLLHQGVSEAAVGPYDMHVKTELSLSNIPFDRARFCLAGDFHKRQFLKDGRFHYVGSPLQHNFGERGDRKCFTLIDTDGWEITDVPVPGPKFHYFASANEFLMRDASVAVDPEFDYIRIQDSEGSLLDSLKDEYPNIQIELTKEDAAPLARVSEAVIGHDLRLLQEYVAQKVDGGDSSLVSEGIELLRRA